MWDLVKKTRQKGKTVFLTTHYMEDAERLCDRVLIMDHGRIVALDRPENLVRSLGSEKKAIFSVDNAFQPEPFKTLSSVTRLEQIGERVIVYGQGEDLLGDVVRTAEKSGCRLRDLRFEQPTLEDVFLALTGREMHD
jgi:ABC-2 type transport system ATP-binding protein